MLFVNVRLHGRVDEKRLQSVCMLLTHRPHEPVHFSMYLEYQQSAGNAHRLARHNLQLVASDVAAELSRAC